MATYVILSTLSPESMQHPGKLPELAGTLARKIKGECPGVRWNGTYAVLGQFHVVDIVEADGQAEVEKVAAIIERVGGATAQIMPAMPWKEFLASLHAERPEAQTGWRWAWGHSGGF
jgi:uncharacterized protein with GYD domain